jgi:hypothetical protein
MEEFVDERPEFVVQGYQFESVLNGNASHIDYSSSEDEEEDHQNIFSFEKSKGNSFVDFSFFIFMSSIWETCKCQNR